MLSPFGSPSPTILTAWALVLRCYTNQDVVVFGVHRGDEAYSSARFKLHDTYTVAQVVGSKHLFPSTDSDDFDTVVAICELGTGSEPSKPPSVRFSILVCRFELIKLTLELQASS